MRNFQSLAVWKKAHRFVLEVYRHTRTFPSEERFGLTAQLRRAAVSSASNIGEGCGRTGERELARFLGIAAGSASEAEYQLLLARDLTYLPDEAHQALDEQVNEVKKMLNSFIHKLDPSAKRQAPTANR